MTVQSRCPRSCAVAQFDCSLSHDYCSWNTLLAAKQVNRVPTDKVQLWIAVAIPGGQQAAQPVRAEFAAIAARCLRALDRAARLSLELPVSAPRLTPSPPSPSPSLRTSTASMLLAVSRGTCTAPRLLRRRSRAPQAPADVEAPAEVETPDFDAALTEPASLPWRLADTPDPDESVSVAAVSS
eukprot:6185319-Pleurochrysis_carterae.AAC.1